MNHFEADSLLARLRRHPDEAGTWLFKEEWFFGSVRALPGTAIPDENTFWLFRTSCAWMLDWMSNPLGAAILLWAFWQRRRWLRANGRRVGRSVWRRAAPAG